MQLGFSGLIYVTLPAGGTISAVTRYNPDGTTTDLTSVTTTPDSNLAKINCSSSALSQTGLYYFLVEAAASAWLGGLAVDVIPVGAVAGDAMILTGAYDAAKTAAQAGNQMDLVNAPNSTALNAIATAMLDLANAIETGLTTRQAIKLALSSLAGKVTVSGSTITFRNAIADSKNRIIATTDVTGQRTAITYDVT